MAKRYFNWKLAFVLVVAMAVFAAAALALHSWQRNTRADQGLRLGEQAYEQGDWEEAARQLGRYLVVDGRNVPVLLKYADAQLNMRPLETANVQQAIAAYSSALRVDGGQTEAAQRLVEIYLNMAAPGEAELKARQFLEGKDDTTLRRFLGVALAQQRKFREAAQVLSELVRDHPDQVLAYEVMGRLAQTRPADVNEPGDYWFDKVVEQNPDSALAYIVRGAFRRQTGDRPGAMADLEHAETLDLTDLEVHLRLAGELIGAGVIDEAREHLKHIQSTDPTERRLWEYWAEVAIRSGSEEEMKTVAETGLEELATQPWDFMPIAVELLIRTGLHDRARDGILQMKEKSIQPARGAFLEGLLAEQQGQLREAVAHWENAIGLGYQSPQDDRWGAKPPLVRMVLASAFVKMGDTQSAIGQLRSLVSQMPTYAGAYLLLARLEAQSGDWEEVIQHARQLRRLVPDNKEATTLELQARIRQLAGTDNSSVDRTASWRDLDARMAELLAAETDEAAAVQIRLLQAESAMLQTDHDRANAILAEVRQNHPDERRAILLQTQVDVGRGQVEDAVTLLRQAVQRFPQDLESVTRLALLYNGLGKRTECEAVVKDALAQMEGARAQRLLGLFLADFYAAWGQDDRLYEQLTAVAEQFPEDVTTKRRLLSLDRVTENEAETQRIINEIKALEGEKGWQWKIEEVRAWLRSDDFATHYMEAVRLLQENLLANPEDQTSRTLLGAAHEKAGEMRLALTSYREALTRSRAPDNLQILLILAAAYEKTDDLPEALRLYRQAMEQAPDNVQVIGRMVEALYKAEEFDEAQRILDEAAERDLRHADLQRLRLEGDLQRGALGSASDILQEMVQQDPNDASALYALAQLRARQEKFDEAQAILRDLRARGSDVVRVVEAQVQVCILQDRKDEAVRLCDELVADSGNAPAHILRARMYATIGRRDKALEDFNRAVELDPEKPGVWLTRANFYRDGGRTEDEIRDVEKALNLAPDDLGIQHRALQLFLSAGDRDLFDRAEAILQRAMETHPENVELRVLNARVLLTKGTARSVEEAERLLNQIEDDHPEQIGAWELLGRLELQRNQPGRALNKALRGLAHNPDARPLLLLKADAEAQQGSPMLAVPTLRELLRQDPNDVDVIARLGDAVGRSERSDKTDELLQMLRDRVMALQGPARRRGERIVATTLYRRGQVGEAETRFGTLLSEGPNDPAPLLAWARLPESLQRSPGLRPAIEDWVRRHPDDIQTLAAMAAAWVGKRDEAGMQLGETLLRSAAERGVESVGALFVRGNLAEMAGRSEEHARLNRRILELDPNNVIATNNLAWFLCETQHEYEEALALADGALERTPEYLDLIDTRGVIYFRMGNLEGAVKDFTRFIELCPPGTGSLATTRFHLAQVYSEMGNLSDATRQLEQISGLLDGTSDLSATDEAEAKRLLERAKKGS